MSALLLHSEGHRDEYGTLKPVCETLLLYDVNHNLLDEVTREGTFLRDWLALLGADLGLGIDGGPNWEEVSVDGLCGDHLKLVKLTWFDGRSQLD